MKHEVFMKATSTLAYVKELLHGCRLHSTRDLRASHFGERAQWKV